VIKFVSETNNFKVGVCFFPLNSVAKLHRKEYSDPSDAKMNNMTLQFPKNFGKI
jgi:hypothetical protein